MPLNSRKPNTLIGAGYIGDAVHGEPMSLSDFLSNFVATVAGGALLTFIFFFLKEKVFPFPDVAGMWFFQVTTLETAYNPYKNMKLQYVAVIWREGSRVRGTVEKMHETSSTGERDYVGKHRARGVLNGYVQKNYFAKDQLFLHVVEDGERRESTNFYGLRVLSHDVMDGTYASTVADQKGVVRWQRNAF